MRKLSPYLLALAFLGCAAASPAATRHPSLKRTASTASAKAAGPRITRLEIFPPAINLRGPLSGQRLLAMGTLPGGGKVDLTDRVQFQSTAPKVAAVEGQRVRAKGDGSGSVVARYAGLSAQAPLTAAETAKPIQYSFQNDVVPVLSRLGCSSGTCHGANSGKGGFKLTLRGYAPELDYLYITRQMAGRRISREAPEQSLLLRKPLMEVAHAGGKRLEKGSHEYNILLGWLLQGAPGPDEKDPKLVSLTALPGDRIYRSREKQRVLIEARFSDGHVEDVTDRAVYRSNDTGVASVTDEGQVETGAPGATAVQAKYMDQLAVLRVTVPYSQKVNPAAWSKAANYVDEAVYAKLRELNLEPSGRCTDEEFIRRATIDVAGTLPTSDEVRAFLADQSPDRREKLIQAVLQRPEYASLWALRLCDISMVRKEHMERKNTLVINQWLTEQFLQNRPWDEIITALVTAAGSPDEHPETLWWASRQSIRPNGRGWVRHYELTGETVAQAFLGQRIQCAKCHNHPTERYTQDDYYRFAAVFAQLNGDGRADPIPEKFVATDPGEVRNPRTGLVAVARPLDRSDLNAGKDEDRRIRFAEWMTKGAGKEMFARNVVNRIWARLFGSGIVDPVDDLRSTNPPRNEALLDALAKDLIQHKYDLKHLMGVIMRSNTYQASSVATPANRIDTQFCSHFPVRRLQGEELLDAIAQVTGVPDRWATYAVGTRAIELSDTELPSVTLDTFGRPNRTTPCECDRVSAPSMSQALELFNGESLQGKLKSGDGIVAQLCKREKNDAAVIEELFLRAFARKPTEKELAAAQKAVIASPNREEVMQDLLWALINSKEFMFDH